MAVVAKMINPTPFDVDIPYDKGVSIQIPADGSVELTMGQLDDFRPGKPGSEATKSILSFEGVFLQDTDLSYDYQALAAIKLAIAERKDRIKNFTERTKNSRIAGGATVDNEAMEELVNSSGYGNMRIDVEKLESRLKALSAIVNTDERKGSVHQTLDPERTCVATNPPREFPSKTALAMFLAENPDIKERHDSMLGVSKPIEEEEDRSKGLE